MNMFIPFTTYIIHRYSLQFWPQLGKWYKNIWFSIILWRTSEEFRYYEIPHTLRTCYSPNFRPWRGEGIGRLGRKSTCWCWSTYDKWVHMSYIMNLLTYVWFSWTLHIYTQSPYPNFSHITYYPNFPSWIF